MSPRGRNDPCTGAVTTRGDRSGRPQSVPNSAACSPWQPQHATGTGTEYENDCQPDCADGKIIDYPVNVTLTGSVLWSHSGPFSYTRITLHYPDAAPAVYSTVDGKVTVTHPATFSIPLTSRPVHPAGD